MRRSIGYLVLTGFILTACTSEPVSDGDSEDDTSSISAVSTDLPISDPAVPAEIREDQLPTYTMVMQFLSQIIATSSGLREKVQNIEPVALCMVNAGYQINNIPPPDASGTPTTAVPPESMISPMLTYLTETCTGIPASDWQTE